MNLNLSQRPKWQIVSAIAAIALVLTIIIVKVAGRKSHDSASPGTKTQEVKKDVWTCPMHPQVKQDKPGKCPICGMDLVKMEQEETSASQSQVPQDHTSFKLSLERQQMIGVKTGVVEKKPLFKSIRASGRVAFDPELYTAQNEYIEAIRQLSRVQDSPLADVRHSAERMVQSARLRLKLLGLSDAQIRGLGSSEAANQNLLLTDKGDSVYIYAEVYEIDLPNIQPGLTAEITASFLGGKTLEGKVISVDRVLNPTTRSAKVRILVPRAKALFRPETFVNVTILSPLGEQVTVPLDAVLDTGTQSWVFLVKDDGTFEPRVVGIKLHVNDQIAIESGLKGGERIVTSANFLIDSESRLKAAAQGQQSSSGGDSKPKTPECPPGEEWHAQMNHCMKKVGN